MLKERQASVAIDTKCSKGIAIKGVLETDNPDKWVGIFVFQFG